MADVYYDKEVADLALFMRNQYLNQVNFRLNPDAILSTNMCILFETIAIAIVNKNEKE